MYINIYKRYFGGLAAFKIYISYIPYLISYRRKELGGVHIQSNMAQMWLGYTSLFIVYFLKMSKMVTWSYRGSHDSKTDWVTKCPVKTLWQWKKVIKGFDWQLTVIATVINLKWVLNATRQSCYASSVHSVSHSFEPLYCAFFLSSQIDGFSPILFLSSWACLTLQRNLKQSEGKFLKLLPVHLHTHLHMYLSSVMSFFSAKIVYIPN